MSLLFIKNKSHKILDESDKYCEIIEVDDISKIADMLYDNYRDETFDKDDWSIVRLIDLRRVLVRILKSPHVRFIRYCAHKDLLKERRKQRKQKNQFSEMGREDTTIVEYEDHKYDFGYDVNPNELISRVKESSLYDMSDLLEIFNELEIKIDWSRLYVDIIDVNRVTKERRKLRK